MNIINFEGKEIEKRANLVEKIDIPFEERLRCGRLRVLFEKVGIARLEANQAIRVVEFDR